MVADRGQGEPAIGLSEAAALTGVSISTLRRWADEGRIPSYRTAGGHRRFREDDLRAAIAPVRSPAEGADAFGGLALARIRRQLAAPRTRDLEWLHGIDDAARDRLRLLGRHLMATVDEYLTRRRPRAAVLAEARQFGLMYGREMATANCTVRQGVEAFTFFRRGLEEAARRHAAQQHLSPAEFDDLRDQLDVLNDRVLLGIAEAYDDVGAAQRVARDLTGS